MLTVHLRINDADTGKPTAVRLQILGANGKFYPPLGRFDDFPTGRNEAVGGHLQLGTDRWCYVDGACEVPLPTCEPVVVRATKGPEFEPLQTTIVLGPGQMALRLAIKRWVNPGESGWVSGDTRCHFLSPHDALLEAAAEDLAVVNLLATPQHFNSLDGTAYTTIANLAALSGQAASLEADGRCVVVNTLNVHPVLGRIGLLHSHRPVFPLSFGEVSDDWSVCDWCDQCHRKSGLTVWVDPFREAAGLLGGEALVAAVLGKIDAIELDDRPRPQPLLPWIYHLWNAGIMIPVVGASGKDRNTVPLGGMRTYAKTTGRQYRDWIEAVRAGRTVATNGPLIHLEVEWQEPGGVINLDTTGAVKIEATVESLTAFTEIQLLRNGEVIAKQSRDPDDPRRGAIRGAFRVDESSWFAARVIGPAGSPVNPLPLSLSQSSPVTVRIAGRAQRNQPAKIAIVRLVEQTQDWITYHGRFESAKSKSHLLDLCRQAVDRLETLSAT